jgi:hypothetical protein
MIHKVETLSKSKAAQMRGIYKRAKDGGEIHFVRPVGMKSRRGFADKQLLTVLNGAKCELETVNAFLRELNQDVPETREVSTTNAVHDAIEGVERAISRLTTILGELGGESKRDLANLTISVPPFINGPIVKMPNRVVQIFDFIADAIGSKDAKLAADVLSVTDEFAMECAILNKALDYEEARNQERSEREWQAFCADEGISTVLNTAN